MSPALMKLSCPNCNGMLELTERADLFKCMHCGQLALLHWAESTPSISRLEVKKKWPANFLRPGSALNWQGGELILTARELAFVPHEFNFGPIERAVLPLLEIKELKLVKAFTAALTDVLTLIDLQGEEWGLRVYDGEVLQEEIERASERKRT